MHDFLYVPSTDQLEDELQNLVDAKQEFLRAMEMAYKESSNRTVARVALIAAEQSFDEALYPELLKLRQHIDMHNAILPKSDMLRVWEEESIKHLRNLPKDVA